MKREKKIKGKQEISLKYLLNVYKTVKIPWLMLLLVVLASFGSQTIGVKLAEYSSKIETGTMTGGSFLICYVLFTVIYDVLETGYELANGVGRAQMGRNVRRHLWGKMLRLPVSAYEKEEPQRFVSRVTKDTDLAYGAITAVIQIVSLIYGVTIAVMKVAKIFGGYTWIFAAIIPVLLVCSWVIGKMQYRMDRMLNAAYAKMTNFYSERLPNITYIKTNNMEQSEYEKGVKASNEKYKTDITYKVLFGLQMPLQSLANYLSLVFVLIVASSMVRAGTLTGTQMKELLLYFDIVMANATLLLGIWQIIKASHGGCEKISEIIAAPTEDMGGACEAQGQQDIVFDGVSFGYTEDKLVLKNAGFTIPKGKVTAIVGENGSGKSTVIRLLERFDAPVSGEIRVGERSLMDLDCAKWRDSLGYVFQGNQMVQGTVRENLTYGIAREYTEEEMVCAAKDAEAYEFIMEKEEQFDTPVGAFDSEFSGGQLQRLAIARAFMKAPDYLVMDEATSGIDQVKEACIMKRVKEKMQDKTVILISHNIDVIKSADHIVVLRNGEVEAEGSVDEVSEQSSVFQSFLNAGQAETAV